jgi:hypothetical protein
MHAEHRLFISGDKDGRGLTQREGIIDRIIIVPVAVLTDAPLELMVP